MNSRFTLSLLLALPATLAFVSGCSGNTDEASTDGANTVTADKMVELAQAGAFFKTSDLVRTPTAFEVGFADEMGQPLEGQHTIPVTYHDDHGLQVSDAVTLRVPAGEMSKKLISFAPSFADGPATEQAYALLAHPEGTWKRVPVSGGGSYPLSSECFGFRVGEDFGQAPVVDSYGASKATGIVYGFTSGSGADLEANGDVPWENGLGDPGNEPFREAAWSYGMSNKPFQTLAAEWVRVPAGKNLVLKVKYDEFWGVCGIDGDTATRNADAFTKAYIFQAK